MNNRLYNERSDRPNDEPLVELRDVFLDFDEKPILRKLNLSVERKERMVIMGQSGAGKSTLLRLLLGILRPTSGRVFFQGHDLAQCSQRQLNDARARIAMVFQSSALISSYTVHENLALPLRELTHQSRAEIDRIVAEKLALVGMEETENLMPEELSGGMRKRVAIARALVLEPELLLFDEPTTGLDPVLSAIIDELIINLTEQTHTTSIIVTHELASAFRVATRMAMLFQGKIIEEEGPEDFRESHNPVIEQFIEGRTEGPIH